MRACLTGDSGGENFKGAHTKGNSGEDSSANTGGTEKFQEVRGAMEGEDNNNTKQKDNETSKESLAVEEVHAIESAGEGMKEKSGIEDDKTKSEEKNASKESSGEGQVQPAEPAEEGTKDKPKKKKKEKKGNKKEKSVEESESLDEDGTAQEGEEVCAQGEATAGTLTGKLRSGQAWWGRGGWMREEGG